MTAKFGSFTHLSGSRSFGDNREVEDAAIFRPIFKTLYTGRYRSYTDTFTTFLEKESGTVFCE